jgi:hypothetical protein
LHVPEEHFPAPPLQRMPSFVGSVAQTPLVQTGALHVSPPPQTTPQPPQFLTSAVIAVSQPSLGSLLQSLKPALQVKPQVPLVHVAVVLAPVVLQLFPHVPQLLGSLAWVHAPLQ